MAHGFPALNARASLKPILRCLARCFGNGFPALNARASLKRAALADWEIPVRVFPRLMRGPH